MRTDLTRPEDGCPGPRGHSLGPLSERFALGQDRRDARRVPTPVSGRRDRVTSDGSRTGTRDQDVLSLQGVEGGTSPGRYLRRGGETSGFDWEGSTCRRDEGGGVKESS